MKYLLLVLALTVQVAQAMEYDSPYIQAAYEDNGVVPINPNECIPASLVKLEIIGKLDDHLFETVSILNGEIVARGALKTHKADFKDKGLVGELKVHYRGFKEEKLTNGFMAKFGLWEACE